MQTNEITIGPCRLLLGDCRDWLSSIEAGTFDATITDPPYGVGLVRKSNDFRGSKFYDDGASLQASVVYQDDEESTRELIQQAMPLILRASKRAALFTGNRLLFDYPKPTAIGCAYVSNGGGCDKWGFGCFNPILYYGNCPYLATGKGSRPNSFADNQPGDLGIDHPCPKPLRWMKWLVERASLPGETVLDCFAGSGTTGVACVQTGRRFVGIEREPRYFDIAVKRIEAAVHDLEREALFLSGGETKQAKLWEGVA